MEVLQEDMGESTMQCTNHPFKSTTTNPGGICAFCLQEKLGKLVSSSFPIPFFPSSSSSPSPSFRSDYVTTTTTSSRTLSVRQNASTNPNTNTSNNGCHYHHYQSKRTRIPFFLTQKKKKADLAAAGSDSGDVLFKRSKSTTTPQRRGHFMDDPDENSPRKRGFWSFFNLSKQSSVRRSDSSSVGSLSQRSKKREEFAAATVVVDESESPNPAAFGRRVSRSRSVGCGSKSFSGDFFERISTGFGDCTLRRVESQREGDRRGGEGRECIKERVKCGGIFSGFMITSSSSSSSYWVSSSTEENGKSTAVAAKATPAAVVAHGRSKSWGWAFASPIRAFKPSSFSGKREISNKTTTPNLNAIPSLLTVRGHYLTKKSIFTTRTKKSSGRALVILGRASPTQFVFDDTATSPNARFWLDNLSPQPGSKKKAKRKGRGILVGQGGNCGFEMRGQKSRSSPGVRRGFEGGQMPLYRRILKLRGITGGKCLEVRGEIHEAHEIVLQSSSVLVSKNVFSAHSFCATQFVA